MPTSSAQIERDFGVSGMMVTAQRTRISAHNIDMSSFLNRNRSYVDITQCPKLSPEQLVEFIPSNVLVGLEDDEMGDWDDVLASCFSDTNEECEDYKSSEKRCHMYICIDSLV